MDTGYLEGCSTAQDLGEPDTSSDGTSPTSISGHLTLESYLGEDLFP